MRNKCICIKDYDYNSSNIYRAGNTYEYTDQKFVSRELPDGYNVMFSKGEYLYFRKYQDPLAEKGYGLFTTHFTTISEIRDKKLNELFK